MGTLRISVLILFTCVPLFAGCGGNSLQQVSGVVTLDGEPLEGAAVSFIPVEGGRPAAGQTDAEGRFELASFTAGDGLPPGNYKVTVVKVEAQQAADAASSGDEAEVDPAQQTMGNMERGVRFLTPVKYSSPLTTDLVVEISPEIGPVQLDLKSK